MGNFKNSKRSKKKDDHKKWQDEFGPNILGQIFTKNEENLCDNHSEFGASAKTCQYLHCMCSSGNSIFKQDIFLKEKILFQHGYF